MSDSKKIDENQNEVIDEENGQKLANTDFMREKIKERPINRKKLLRRTIITVTLAVIFGLVACCTFFFLEPFISNHFFTDNSTESVSYPEEVTGEEMQPEDMYANEAAIAANEAEDVQEATQNDVQKALSSYSFDSTNYQQMIASMKKTATNAEKYVVTVTGVSSDTDWINEAFERTGSVSGIIVAKGRNNVLILVDHSTLSSAESIEVTFNDGKTYSNAEVKAFDPTTDLCIVAVPNDSIDASTLDSITICTLGSSSSSTLSGTPIIAIGSPTGTSDSICYGAITSGSRTLDLADSAYKLISTDIYTSTSGSGVILDLSGNVTGIITMAYNNSDGANQLSAYGITEIKPLIEKLSAGETCAYLGVHGTLVPDYISKKNSIPEGAYVSQIDMQSPAMDAGIQSGDVITSFDNTDILDYDDLVDAISSHSSGDEVKLTIMRQGASEYSEMSLTVTLKSTSSIKTDSTK